ncbi:MAG: hypothetical protein NTX32_00990 [Candidatus Firestonebacteria bacterium]|nr:hypothetical protein [Candidatus Firestonebacteria bacterium]
MKKTFLLLFLITQTYASDKISMAVNDFDASGVTPAIAASVADFIQDGLMQTGRFTVVERKNVQKLLKEQMFQKTGCTSTECAVEIGKMLNVNNIVTGRVSQMGSRIVISLSLVDVEAGKIGLTDSVECGSVELLNTGSKKLAEHFSKGVAVKGKVIKVTGNDAIINLGMEDGIKNGDILIVERFGEAIKDEAGKLIFQEKTKIGALSVKDASTSGSKGQILQGAENIKSGDVVELKIEKLRSLDPILTSSEYNTYVSPSYESESSVHSTTRKVAAINNDEEFPVGMGFTLGFNGVLSYVRYNTFGTITGAETPIDTLNSHFNFSIDFGSSVSEFLNVGNLIQFMIPGFTDTAAAADNNRSLFLMNDGLMLRFYPFVGLLNPSFAQYKKPSQQRGDFQPYLGLNGNLFLGFFDPDINNYRSKIDTSGVILDTVFILGFGLDLKAGFEVGNMFYAEIFWRILSTPAGTSDVKNLSKVKIGTQKYIVNLNTLGVGAGFRF